MSAPDPSTDGDLDAIETMVTLQQEYDWDSTTRNYSHLNYLSIRELDVRPLLNKPRVEFADPDNHDTAWLIGEPVPPEEMP